MASINGRFKLRPLSTHMTSAADPPWGPLPLEPTALSNRLETMLLGNHPVPAPSNEVSVVGEVTNGIIIAAKAAVNTLFLSQRRAARCWLSG